MKYEIFELRSAPNDGGTAVLSETVSLSRNALFHEMEQFQQEILALGLKRPLVMLEASNEVGPVVAYLAALQAGWPIILSAPGGAGSEAPIRSTFQPNVVVRASGASWEVEPTGAPPADLHPDLAVLLSTSGTTGAPKLVRLSRRNIQSNAEAIEAYLDVRPSDVAITALPFHYSYGMSVLHVQVIGGRPLVLTGRPVTDPEFWALARSAGATSLALVPTQIEALDAAGWDRTWMPRIRYMTQAGGRLEQGLARRMTERSRAEGWSFFMMYGQTEAGPRMAYLPPEDALSHPGSIGRAIPGGRLRLVDAAGDDIPGPWQAGELIFEGPGVMQGYALARPDLATPEGPSVLRTGDIAERLDNGYFRILGRNSRFLKLHGLRIGLDEIELLLQSEGTRVLATGSDQTGLVLFLPDGTDATARLLADQVSRRFGLPSDRVRAAVLADVPLLDSGKIDYRSLAQQAERLPQAETSLGAILARAMRDPAPDPSRSFRDHGGDSLGYLAVQLYFAEQGIPLPEDWDDLPLLRLSALDVHPAPAGPGATAPAPAPRIGADLLVRVGALLGVIALHATTWPTAGGAYLLLALTGYSLARFQFAPLGRGEVGRMLLAMLLPVLTAYYALIFATEILWSPLPPEMFLLVSNLNPDWAYPEPYWFVSTYVQVLLIASLPFLLPRLRAMVVRAPFAAGLAALLASVLTVGILGLDDGPVGLRHRNPVAAFELVALGWSIWFAATVRQRVLVSLVLPAIWAIHWSDASGSIVLFCGLGLLVVLWRLRLPAPVWLLRAVTWTGGLALFAYIAHAAILSATLRALPVMGELPRFLVVLSGSLALAWALRRTYETGIGLLDSMRGRRIGTAPKTSARPE